MNKTTIHKEPTKYLYDSKKWLYRFMYAMFYDYINKANYTYDADRQCSARAFGNVNYYYFSNVNYSNNISISSSWITDADGNVNQYLAYMPFGEQLVDQRATGHDIRFKFTGKERDAETGMDYFGARYYSSDLSVWLSVDPLADKYPSLSPYMYTAGNPVMLVDPDGDSLNVSNLDVGQQDILIADLNSQTGLSIYVNKIGNLDYKKEGNEAVVNDGGSETARTMMLSAMDNETKVTVTAIERGVSHNNNTENTIALNFTQT